MSDSVPSCNGLLCAKVLLVNEDAVAKRKSRLRLKKENCWIPDYPNKSQTSESTERPSISEKSLPSNNTIAPRKITPLPAPPSDASNKTENFIDVEDISSSSNNNTTTIGSNDESINMTTQNFLNFSSSASDDMVSPNATFSIDLHQYENTSIQATREELAARREAVVQEKVKEALEFKQEV